MDDSEIIELFFSRSEQAVKEIENKYGKLCRKVAAGILNSIQDAEECVNDAYLGVWDSIPPQRPSSLPSYICKIVRNLSIKRYHSNAALKRNSFYDAALDELGECIASSVTVDSEYNLKVLGESIDRFLSTLDSDSRVIFVKRYWFAQSLSEIAESFRVSENNIAVRLSRTRAKLKKHLTKEGIFI